MDTTVLVGIAALAMAMMTGGGVLYYLFFARTESNFRNLMGSGGTPGLGAPSEVRARLKNDESGEEYEKLKKLTKKSKKKHEPLTLDEKYFRAGMYTPREKREFQRMRIIYPCIFAPIGLIGGSYAGMTFGLLGLVMGGLLGMQAPNSVIERRMKARDDEILFYLPLVIEQIAIGVSSSLDIGPCIQRVISMADERDSHNVVTELLRYAQYHVKSGASLEDALNEVGKKSGQTELKHAFLALSQVAKHGGEITRQLQELADAVGAQREAKIEGKIKKLELEATFPVTLVFLGFIVILLVGFFIQIKAAF